MFGSSDNFILLVLSLLFRIFRALHDGLSDRGKFFIDDQNYGIVGWWPWHLLNWAGRDFFILLLYAQLLIQDCPLSSLLLAVSLQFLLHHFFYGWASTHRNLFK